MLHMSRGLSFDLGSGERTALEDLHVWVIPGNVWP